MTSPAYLKVMVYFMNMLVDPLVMQSSVYKVVPRVFYNSADKNSSC